MGKDTSNSSRLTEAPERTGVYRATYDPERPGTVSDTVIEAIAKVAGVDPTKTMIPLADRINPDALNALFTDNDGEVQVTFNVCGLEVLVQSDGRVRIVDETVIDRE